MSTYSLAVDTSSNLLSVAVRADRSKSYETVLKGSPRHSEQLIDCIRKSLKARAIKKERLTHLLWGLGPGSFTGLRIGLSVLKAMRLGLKANAFGASSLDVIALGSQLDSGKLWVAVDARRNSIYAACYEFRNGSAKKVKSDTLYSLDAFQNVLKTDIVLTGDALLKLMPQVKRRLGESVHCLSESHWYPKASALFKVWDEHRNWMKPLTLRNMQPKYLRRSEAEDNRFRALGSR